MKKSQISLKKILEPDVNTFKRIDLGNEITN